MQKRQPPNVSHPSTRITALESSEILRDAPIGIFKSTPEGRFLDANPTLARMFGYGSPEELIDSVKDIAEELYADPEDRLKIMRYLETLDEGCNMECRFVRRDGSFFWGSNNARPVRDEKGRVVHYQSFLIDITKRKEAERALEENERLFRGVFEQSFDYLGVLTRDGIVIRVNDTALDLVGADSFSVLKKHFWETPWWTHSKEEQKNLKKAIKDAADGKTFRFEVTHRDRSGNIVHVDTILKPVKDKTGDITFIVAEGRNITARRQAEAALRASEEKYHSIFEHSQDAILLTRPDGAIIEANQAACEMLGRSLEDLRAIGRNGVVDVTDPRLHAALEERARKGSTRAEFTMFRANGEKFPADVSSTVFTDRDGQLKTSMIIRDVTEKKKAEKALKERDQQFRKLSFHIPGVIYQFRKSSDGTYRVPLVSEKLKDLFGCSPEDVRNDFSPIADVILKEDRAKFFKSVECSAEEMKTWECEFRVQVPGGPVKWLYGRSTPEKVDDGGIVWHGFMTDVTERRQMEDELRKSEERFRTMADDLPALVCEFLPDSTLSFVNRAYCECFGVDCEDLMGHRFLDYVPEDARASVMDKYLSLTPQNPVMTYEHHVMTGAGKRWQQWTDRALFDDRGNVSKCQSIGIDVTERKTLEEKLRESEERYRTYVEKSFGGVYVIQDGAFVFLNDRAASFVGYTPDELVGRPSESIVHPDDRNFTRSRAKMMLKGVDQRPYEFRVITKDGQTCWIMEMVSSIKYGGKPAVLGNSIDITSHKLAEEKLRKSEELYRNLFENHAAVKLIIDPETGRIEDANQAAVDYYGWPYEELTRMKMQDINTLPPEEIKNEMEKARTARRIDFGFRHRRVDGSVRDVEVFSSRIEVEGEKRLHSIVHDVTNRRLLEEERKKLEEQLNQSQKMEAVGQLAGGIAHDFNNILMIMQGYVSLMMEEDGPSRSTQEYLNNIQGQIRSAANLTRQLLGFARSGHYDIKPSEMNEILERNAAMFERAKKEIRIHRDYGKHLWTTEVDGDFIGQVFMNLFVNAWQAMPGGGDLFLKTENAVLDENRVKVHGTPPGRYVKISVTDTGVGMDEKTKNRIFDPFFTTKERGRGTGLGLAVAYGIAKRHKGFISVESEPGRGTTFDIYLPASMEWPSLETSSPQEVMRGSGTVLLVDDEASVLDVTRRMLEHLGYTAITAGSGDEAVTIYGEMQEEIDLVLLDMIMPEMSGEKVFRILREMNPGVRVMLLSGYSVNGKTQEILDGGCAGFIQKPVSLSDLSWKIHDVLMGAGAPGTH